VHVGGCVSNDEAVGLHLDWAPHSRASSMFVCTFISGRVCMLGSVALSSHRFCTS